MEASRLRYGNGLRAWMVAALLVSASLSAQENAPAAEPRGVDLKRGPLFEVTPHTGMMGGSGLFGLKLGMTYGSVSIEASGEQVIGQTANLYPLFVNLGFNLSTNGRLLPYGLVGGGLLLTVPTNALGAETVSAMGLNVGGGARFFITERFGFRLEVKQFVTSVTGGLTGQEELLMYQEIGLGATFLFN